MVSSPHPGPPSPRKPDDHQTRPGQRSSPFPQTVRNRPDPSCVQPGLCTTAFVLAPVRAGLPQWRRSDGRIGQRSRAGSDRRREFSRLATSRSIAALFAQPSFPDGIGIVRANCRCRIVRRAAASSGVPPRRTKQKLRRRPRAGGRCGLVIPCRHAEVSRGCGHAAARSSAGRRRRVGCWRAGGR
jgi:hypothetical protein